jgi:energy-coupling factor transporter ATP-binding protein EcfA2
MPQFLLKRLVLHQYRGFAPGLHLDFSPALNVLLGMNGTGKTTLLRLIAMTISSDFSALRDQPFDLEYDLVIVNLTIQARLRNTAPRRSHHHYRATTSERTALALAEAEHEWSYSLRLKYKHGRFAEIEANPKGTTLHGVRENPQQMSTHSPFDRQSFLGHALMEAWQVVRPGSTENEKSTLNELMAAAMQALDAHSNVGRFDEALGTYEAISGTRAKEAAAPPGTEINFMKDEHHIFPLMSRFVPQEVIKAVEARVTDDEDLRIVSVPSSKLPFLQNTCKLLGFVDAEMLLQLTRKEGPQGRTRWTFVRPVFGFSDSGNRFLTDYDLSFGQKRLLSFLYYAAANPHIFIVDELVNGFHHEWIRETLDTIGPRQAFLTSQNPLLLDELAFESAEDAQRCFIICRTLSEPPEPRTMMAQNLSLQLAEDFFRAYEVGVQHISYILRTKDLW